MLFNSLGFLVFLAVVLALYYPLSHKSQNRLLLVASLFFYACWNWRFLAPLLFTTSLDYWCAARMAAAGARARRKPYLIVSVVANLSLLGFFKYFNFFSASIGGWHLDVILPIGISFYTFQALSYTIDVYRGDVYRGDVYRGDVHRRAGYFDFLLAVVYFPHLVAGPIQRAASLLPQVTNARHPAWSKAGEGIHLILWGYFKKMYVADNLAPFVNQTFALPHPDGLRVLLASWAFAFQIYCDFSGYTDIARGLAKLMGFEFMLNFRQPYLAAGPREFWSRWHISLSTWLRDYLYKPLGGNRMGPRRTYLNLMTVMVIGGLWHGAAWTFVLWGAWHGALLVAERFFETYIAAAPRWLRLIVFCQLTCYGWLIFRAGSLAQLATMTAALLSPFTWVAVNVIPLSVIALTAVSMKLMHRHWRSIELRAVSYAVLLYLVLFRGGQPRSFIYFRF